jgi:hypothetical protein
MHRIPNVCQDFGWFPNNIVKPHGGKARRFAITQRSGRGSARILLPFMPLRTCGVAAGYHVSFSGMHPREDDHV